MRATLVTVSAMLFVVLVAFACSGDDEGVADNAAAGATSSGSAGGLGLGPGPGGSGGTSGSPNVGTSGSPGTSGAPGTSGNDGGGTSSTSSSSTSSSSSSSSGTSGAPQGTDDGLIPADSLWHTTSEWYRNIATAPVADGSGTMIGALHTWGDSDVFQIDFSFNVLDAAGGTATTFPQDDEADNVPVPVPPNGYIEGDHAYNACPGGDDCHLLILDHPNNRLYEVYQAHKNAATWSGFVAMWKLDRTYPRTNRGAGCTSADAAGMAITPGLIGFKETKKGAINHALRFIMKNDYIHGSAGDKNVPNVVYPASHGSTAGASANGIPYGGRLRLKSSISDTDPRLTSPGAKAIAKALHTYGMILSDGGNLPLVAESARVYHDTDATATWSGVLAPRDLDFLRPSDFEVVGIPKDYPNNPGAGWYTTTAEYNAQLQKPLGCDVAVQPP